MATDALLAAMAFYCEDECHVPPPSPGHRQGSALLPVPPVPVAKILLLNEMVAQQVRPSDLAARLGTTRQEVNRLIDLSHTTKIDRIAEALAALGKRLELSVA